MATINETTLSIKMSKKEAEIIAEAAKRKGETRSGYARRVLLESAQKPIYTGKDVMQTLWGIGWLMQRMTPENSQQAIKEINTEGEYICRILSSK